MGDRYPSDWNSRRKKVYKQDNHQCTNCGAMGGSRGTAELHAHHKTPIADGGSHRYSNLTTVCKSCHEDIHGHGVGGRRSSTTDTETEFNPASLALALLIVGIGLTYFALLQVLPAGEVVSEEYDIEYHSAVDDPNGYGLDYQYDVGEPLRLQYELSDNVISVNQKTQLQVLIHNPSEHHLQGHVEVYRHTNYRQRGYLTDADFDLAPKATVTKEISLNGDEMVAASGFQRRTTTFNAEAHIFTDPYSVTTTSKRDWRADKMELEVRKPLVSRLGLYWLSFLGLCLLGVGYAYFRQRE